MLQESKRQQLQQQQADLAQWGRRKFDELNEPLTEQDAWVHARVLAGQQRAFTNARMGARHWCTMWGTAAGSVPLAWSMQAGAFYSPFVKPFQVTVH